MDTLERANGTAVVEAKGIASPWCAADLGESGGMDGSRSRTVQRIQRQLRASGSGCPRGIAAASDVAELQVRLRRLHRLDDRFTHIGLSRFVTPTSVTPESDRVGGACVAREV